MTLWCVGHEQDGDAASADAQIIYQGDSLCLDCFEARGGYQ